MLMRVEANKKTKIHQLHFQQKMCKFLHFLFVSFHFLFLSHFISFSSIQVSCSRWVAMCPTDQPNEQKEEQARNKKYNEHELHTICAMFISSICIYIVYAFDKTYKWQWVQCSLFTQYYYCYYNCFFEFFFLHVCVFVLFFTFFRLTPCLNQELSVCVEML